LTSWSLAEKVFMMNPKKVTGVMVVPSWLKL